MPNRATVLMVLALFAAVGCGEQTELRLHIDDPREGMSRTVVLRHAALARLGPFELPDVTLPGISVVFVGESPDVCSTLSMGFLRGEEHFATLQLPDEGDGAMGVAVSGPDGSCDAWAEGGAEHQATTDDDTIVMDLDSIALVSDDGPWHGATVTLEGSIEAELCPGVFEGTSPSCGVPVVDE